MKSYTEIISEQQKQLANILSEIKKTKSLHNDEMTGKCFRVTRGNGTTYFRVIHAWGEPKQHASLINIEGLFFINNIKDDSPCMWLGTDTKEFKLNDLEEVTQEQFTSMVKNCVEYFFSSGVSKSQ